MHNKPDFQKLTPTTCVDLGIYQDAFEFIFRNDDIRNIAISGAYSSGKSSILESLKIKFTKKKFINISLAHFRPHDNEEGTQDKLFLEGKIINQLIHQIAPENIPQTNFGIKKKITPFSIFKYTTLLSIFILFSLHIIFFEKWGKFIADVQTQPCENLLKFFANKPSLLVSGIILFSLGFIFVYDILSLVLNKNFFKKVKVQGAELELFSDCSDSYFDKYLNEVLYLFENSNADIIAFEDIDRFDSYQIFERLHEVNFLINNHIKNNKIIRFIYLLRDDIFISKDRTKFFDFIIPTIPVIDGSNSIDEIIRLFNYKDSNNQFKFDFLQSLSLYIDDMRILKNIYNEFVIYNGKINTTELDTNKLLAIITYKNLFPRDFSELQTGKKYMAAIFANKTRFIQTEIAELNSNLIAAQNDLEKNASEIAKDIKELDLIFYGETNRNALSYHERDRLQQDIAERKLFRERIKSNHADELKAKISTIKDNIQAIQNKKLQEIITRENIDRLFNLAAENDSSNKNRVLNSEYLPLLKYLIRNGFIDENFADYMTFFYATSLSKEDKTFLRCISDRKPKNFAYSLRDTDKVLSRLTPHSFDQIEVLNFDLFIKLLTSDKYKEHLERTILQLKNTKNFEFIISFFAINKERASATTALNRYWPEFFLCMRSEGSFTANFIKEYTILTIYNSSDEEIKKINNEHTLTDYISNEKTFLNIFQPSIDRIIHIFKIIKVSFISIEYNAAVSDLFTEVYHNSLYAITIDNISLILNNIYGATPYDISRKNFSLIFKEKGSPLYNYVIDNLPIYLEALLNKYSSFYDDEIPHIFILNNDSIQPEQKIAYIKNSNTKILNITDIINPNIWGELLSSNSISATDENFWAYFSHTQQYDDSLIKFTNENSFEIKPLEDSEDSLLNTLFDETITCNKLDNSRYTQILSQLNYIYESEPPKNIDQDKVDIAIDLKLFKMTPSMLIAVRDAYPNNTLKFIISNFSDYVNIFQSIPFSIQEFSQILSSDLTNDQKLTILGLNSSPVSAFGDNYSEEIVDYILQHNLDESEIQRILQSYAEHDSLVKNTILNITLNKRNVITDGSFQLPIELCNDIFKSDHIENGIKIEFFTILLPHIDRKTFNSCLKILPLPEFKNILTTGNKRIEANAINEALLSILKEKGWVKEFSLDANDNSFYDVYS